MLSDWHPKSRMDSPHMPVPVFRTKFDNDLPKISRRALRTTPCKHAQCMDSDKLLSFTSP